MKNRIGLISAALLIALLPALLAIQARPTAGTEARTTLPAGISVLADETAAPPAPSLTIDLPTRVGVFGKAEITVRFAPQIARSLERLSETQVHDAYDADRNGAYVRLSADFVCGGRATTVPGFAMRDKPKGPWVWRVRFSPRRPGEYSVTVHFLACIAKNELPITLDIAAALPIVAEDRGREGPLVSPDRVDQPPLLRRCTASGATEALWLFGACRAWVAETQDQNNDWSPDEWLDRETELFAPMRANGYNLLNQWMAPWEFMLVHHDRAEFWKDGDGHFKRTPLPKNSAWSPYQCFDQGRAAAFDALVQQCEGDKEKRTIYLLLSPMPHQAFENSKHPWGSSESGWSPADDSGKQTPERLNGFSAFPLPGESPEPLGVWNFFSADPSRELDDWRCRLFDHQANYWRYVIARWGYSRAIGVWVLADELDAVGDEVGSLWTKKGWWAHPQCERWLANTIRLFRGELKRSDGAAYQGDPFAHPLHAAVTSARGQAERGGNIDWTGGPAGAQPDLFGFHWYPGWGSGATWTDVWSYTINGVSSYSESPIGEHPTSMPIRDYPRLISEFGAPDRAKPADEPSYLYPTLYHHAIWAAIFCGQAGTPMDWDDGKEFGELTFRKRAGLFDEEHYPIDNAAQLRAFRKFIDPLPREQLRRCRDANGVMCDFAVTPAPLVDGEGLGVGLNATHYIFALFNQKNTSIYGWLFEPGPGTAIKLTGLQPGNYRLRWFDPWTGEPIAEVAAIDYSVGKDGNATLPSADALAALRQSAEPFPKSSRLARGQDAAFAFERDH